MGTDVLERIEIEAFLTLAEELHFGRTAQRLHVTPGRISQAIKALERRVGAPLFERTSRTVALTDIGRRLDDELRPAVESMHRAIGRAITAGRSVRTRLDVGYSTPWCGDVVLAAAGRLQQARPGCEVAVQEVQLRDPLGGLRSGSVHIQLTEFPIAEPDIITGPVVFTEPRAVVVPADHPLAHCVSVTLDDLTTASVLHVGGDVPEYFLEHHFPTHAPNGLRIPHGPPAMYWHETLTHVGAGHGVTIAALRAARYHSHPGVVYVPLTGQPPIEYGLLWRADNHDPLVREFADAVIEAAAA